ncbi:hypothetical protein H2200_003598 [Cladophialophora chaetospira]|uniref:Uncharacterized protein n=1 Tax=Cladophialophora chaetospira TaxID=386627 RepID=A0AA39CL88_9EURO|nr:hypothetical protein H2200_003598 [Cladophialophora chaetospira]
MSFSCPYSHVPYSKWRLDVLWALFKPSEGSIRRIYLPRERAIRSNHNRHYSASAYRLVQRSKNTLNSQHAARIGPSKGGQSSQENAGQPKPFNPNSPEGREALLKLLAELQAVGQKAHRSRTAQKRLKLKAREDEESPYSPAPEELTEEDRHASVRLIKDLLESEIEVAVASYETQKPSIVRETILGPQSYKQEPEMRPTREDLDCGIPPASATRDRPSNLESPVFSWIAGQVRREAEEKRLATGFLPLASLNIGKPGQVRRKAEGKRLTTQSLPRANLAIDTPPASRKEDGPSIPESPVFSWIAANVEKRLQAKITPSDHHNHILKNNPWAKILASAIRACQGSGARLPAGLLLDIGYFKNPVDEKIYLMPANLANLDALEAKMAQELADLTASVPSVDGDEGQPTQSKEIAESFETDELEEPVSPGKSHTKDRKGIRTQSRLLSNQTWLNFVTNAVTQPSKKALSSSAPSSRESVAGEVSKLVHYDGREGMSTAHHYLQNKRRFDAGVTGKADEGKRVFTLNKLQWQPDMPSRIVHIMRQRILAALRALVDAEAASKAQDLHYLPSAVLSLPVPASGKFTGDELQRQSVTSISNASASKLSSRGIGNGDQADDSVTSDSSTAPDPDLSTSVEASVSAPARPTYHRLGHPDWLPGSILLYTGPNKPSFPRPSTIPPLPSGNPLTPPMIAVADTYRFPIFSIYRLFSHPPDTPSHHADQDRAELDQLLAQHAIFRSSDSTGVSSTAPVAHLLLVRSLQGPARVVIEEIWRLWQYLGGENMDVEYSEEE